VSPTTLASLCNVLIFKLPSFNVTQSPSSSYALLNRIAFHPQAGFRDGDHVLVKDRYPLTVKCVSYASIGDSWFTALF
jgi:hypothetical protein